MKRVRKEGVAMANIRVAVAISNAAKEAGLPLGSLTVFHILNFSELESVRGYRSCLAANDIDWKSFVEDLKALIEEDKQN